MSSQKKSTKICYQNLSSDTLYEVAWASASQKAITALLTRPRLKLIVDKASDRAIKLL